MLKALKRDPVLLIPLTIGGIFLAGGIMVFAAVLNEALGHRVVLETFPGTKSVCVATQYNYSVKHTVCTKYQSVPATCKKVERHGPIFDTFVNTECN
jgi:hypothetical protein